MTGTIVSLARRVAALLLLLIMFAFISPASIKHTSAQFSGGGGGAGGGGETPFGGLNTFRFICTCSGDVNLYVMDYRTNQLLVLLYSPGRSTLYLNYNVFGQYLLGTYGQTSGQCQYIVGEECETQQSDGQLGTQPGTGTS